ncbi:MAG TPA: amino acid adenylation domain-containing protein, partial [Thermoanaerobaculia bacterium]|nr:amino acid adenylation domain-containing protein [Thermoanaerobaculia bacterium]
MSRSDAGQMERSRVFESLLRKRGIQAPRATAIPRRGKEGPCVLSFAQERLWLLDQMAPGGSTYNMPTALRLDGTLDVPALARSLSEVARRHGALRTRFPVRDGVPVQDVAPPVSVPLPMADLSGLRGAVRDREAWRLVGEAVRRPFGLASGPPFRAQLLRFASADHVALLTVHHIAGDGWSMEILVRELAILYGSFARGSASPLPEPPIQYTDFAVWQRTRLTGELLALELEFWRERLAGAPRLLELPSDRPRPAVKTFRGALQSWTLPAGLARDLREVGQRHGTTLFVTLLAGFQALLTRLSGQPDVLVGTPVAGRGRSELEGVIGVFINTLVLRADLSGDPSFAELLERVREASLAAQEHQELPFERLVEELAPERSLSHPPLVQVMFALQNAAPGGQPTLEGVRMSPLEPPHETSKLDLALTLGEGAEELSAAFEYSTDLFDTTTVARWAGHLERLLAGAVAAPAARLSELPWLAPAERAQVLMEWNDTGMAAAGEALPDRVAAQARRAPDAVAVTAGDLSVSSGFLDQWAGRLAGRLRRRGAGAESVVGLQLPRSPEMVAAMLAVWRSGGAYLPLDSSLPAFRTEALLADARALLLSHEEVWLSDGEETVPVEGVHAGGLAYVIYTSGSTGRPKGVAVSHGALDNLVDWHLREYGVTPADRASQVAGLGFDASVWEIWPYLVAGASVHLLPEEVEPEPVRVAGWLAEAGITHCFLPTPLAEEVLVGKMGRLPALRHLLTGGDRLHRAPSEDPGFHLINHYGPTEGAVVATAGLVATAPHDPRPPAIGRPIANAAIRLLDRDLRPVPVGVAGEMYLAGAGLARGYLHRPDLTAERFLPDPAAAQSGRRVYRTGDLARWSPRGELEFLGRADFQVKVRGFRIETGEIEAALGLHPRVREVAVVPRDGHAGRHLVAYVVRAAGDPLDTGELRAFLRERLPEYMVPSAFVDLPALPLTPNGKVDRAALPDPPEETGQGSVPPRDPVEEVIAALWADALGRERVGVFDGFFELGGHSLLAARVIARVRSTFGVDLSLADLFAEPTVAGLAARVAAALRAGGGTAAPLAPAPRDRPLPQSFAQQRLWFLDRLEPGSPAYNVPLHLRLAGELSVQALAGALAEVARRHEVLRTTFDSVAGEPVQIVGPPPAPALPVVDLTALTPPARVAEAGRLADRESLRPFDLRRGPVFRVTLLRLAAEDHVLLATLHHIAADAWSVEVLRREIAALYTALHSPLREGRPSPLPELPVQYGDFAVWQRRVLESGALEGQMEYWRGRLGSEPAVLELPTDRPRPAVQTYRGAHLPFTLPPEVAAGLLALGRRAGATPFMAALAVFQGLLRRITGQRDVSVGTPVSGRHHVELEALIGFFLNTLVIRVDLPGDPVFAGLLERVRDLCLEAYAHQDLPFERLVDELQPRRSLSHSPLFQVLFVLQHEAPVSAAGEPGWSPWISEPAVAKFDLTLSLAVGERGIQGSLEYNTDLFDVSTAARLVAQLERLAGAAADASGRPLSVLPILSAAESQQLLLEWNDAGGPLAADPALQRLVEEQARRTPDAVAVTLGEAALSYAGLDHRAGRLARHLRALGVGPDARVGLAVERSLEMAVGLLAIFKAGGAYVPLDPAYPRERLGLMLEDAGVEVLVTQAGLLESSDEATLRVFRLDADWEAVPAEPLEPDNAGAALTGEELAYVIFTSGSTGRPKAVALSHRALRNLIDWHLATLVGGARTLQFASLSFDASFHEMFACWGSGGTLHLVSEEVRRNVPALAALLLEAGIEKAILPVVVLHQLAEELGRRDGLPPLLEVTTTGEQLQTTAAMAELFRRLPGCAFHNHYGPSESHVATAYTLSPGPAAWGTHPSIGLPIWNSSVHLLGRDHESVPIGVPGDLYIGGVCLARGYLGRPDLTADRFVPDPFAGEPGARLYRTGDKVRRLPDGNLDFLGRFDHQVKVRGFRVELEEVESVLGRHPGVRQTVVLARGEGAVDKSLVAYVVPEPTVSGSAAGAVEWRAFLRERLPDYMVPGHFVVLEALPLNANGKVDRAALPAPAADRPDLVSPFVAPRNPSEELVAAVWADLLGIERIGVHDDFFALGGHSLMATRVVSRLRDAFHVELPLRGLFEEPTVAGLARRLDEAVRAGAGLAAPPIVPVPRGDGEIELPLSFAQQRLWFIEQLEPGSSHYNVASPLRLRGLLRVEALAGALTGIVRRHQVLRTSFPHTGGRPVQAVAAEWRTGLPVLDLSSLPEEVRQREASHLAGEEARRPFDLAAGPLLRTSLVRLGPAEHVLLLCVHHIVWDGWSEGIFVRELAALYGTLAAGRPGTLPELPVQYADFACWQRRWMSGEVLERQLAYWRQRLAGAPAHLDLPADRQRPAAPAFRGGALPFALPEPASAAVAALGRRHGATLFMTLAAAVDALLHRWTGAEDVVIGTPVAGRDRLEVEGLIGFFVNSLVLRTDLSGDPKFPLLIERARDGALGAYAHQDLPFERLVEELAPDRSRPHSPLFQVLLALQNAPAAALDLPGIELEPLELERRSTRFDLTLSLSEGREGISGTLVYSADLFDAATAERMLGHLGVLLEGIAEEPARRLSELPVLTAAERRQLLEEWNQGRGVAEEEGGLFDVFAARVAEAPDGVAVTCEGRALSYGALRERAEGLADGLRHLGVGPESRVGLCIERSEEMIVGILGILAAGGMYVPVDPEQPQERLELILRDALSGTAAPVVVTSGGLAEKVGREMAGQGIRRVGVGETVEGSGGGPCSAPSGAPPLPPSQRVQSPAPVLPRSPRRPRDVGAYVIYTSGSTGVPKGVVVSQGNVLRLFEATAGRFRFGRGDVWTLFHSFAFDFSVWEIWGALMYGGRLVVVPQEVVRSPGEFHRLLVREGVTV